MARPIILSNGELHVGINNYGLVHDFYFPYVGLENHVAGKEIKHHIGVWVDGRISWLDFDCGQWRLDFSYPHQALVGHIQATNDSLGVTLEFDDAVDTDQNIFMRNIHVINNSDRAREIRIFMHQAFAIGDTRSNTDTVQYLPDSDAVLHYHGDRVFVVSGNGNGKVFDQRAVGLFGFDGHEGTFRDAEDGELHNGTVEHGRVDSTLRFPLHIKAHDSGRVHYWIAAGTSHREALHGHKTTAKLGVGQRIKHTATWWHEWLAPATQVSHRVPEKYRDEFLTSVMVIKSHIDKRGAVIASTDSAMLNYSRDAYAYCWPRDACYVLWPLIRLGYTEEPLKFFEFASKVIHPSGYLMHKFRADGALGSSWHPYLHGDISAPPIQEDETALTLFMFVQYYKMHPSPELLDTFYETLVVPMANFLAEYIDETTHLPRPTYDLWEEVFTTSTYTTAVVFGALYAAADIAEERGDSTHAVTWRAVAEDIYQAAHKHLYNEPRQAFYRGIIVQADGSITCNDTIDSSSLFGAFMFGLFPMKDPIFKHALTATLAALKSTDSHGIARYENDGYHRTSPDVVGNWWPICSLWHAQYCIEQGDTATAEEILDWTTSYASASGILAEQIDPATNRTTSVAPLIWAHAEFAATLLDLITHEPESHAP